MKELLSNILDEAFDVKSNLGQLLEIKSSSLEKLAKTDVLRVMTDFPVDMVRILFNALEDADIKIKPSTIEDYVGKFGKSTKVPSYNKNPWFDTNNRNEFEFGDENSLDTRGKPIRINIEIKIQGTTAQFGIDAHFLRRISVDESKPIKLANLSASDFAKEIAEKTKSLMTKLDPDWEISIKSAEQVMKDLAKDKPPIVNKLKPMGQVYLLWVAGEKDKESKNIDLVTFYPSFAKFGIGWPDQNPDWDDINKNWGSFSSDRNKFRNFSYSFQTELLLEAIPIIFKRLRENNLTIMSAHLDSESMGILVAAVDRNAKFPARYRVTEGEQIKKPTYADIEESKRKLIMDQAQTLNDKAIKMTVDEFRHTIIQNALDPTVKKEPKK